MPRYGPVLGKGDAMWRALSALDGDARLLPRRRHRATSRALRRPGCSGRSCASPDVSFVKALLPPAVPHGDGVVRRRRRPRQPPDARARRSRCSIPQLARRAPAARRRGRGAPRAARAAAVRDRLRRRDRDADRRLARGRPRAASRRSTSTSTATATSRSRRSRRWRCTVLATIARAARARGAPDRARAGAAGSLERPRAVDARAGASARRWRAPGGERALPLPRPRRHAARPRRLAAARRRGRGVARRRARGRRPACARTSRSC